MERLRTPDLVAGAAGAVLLISLFLPWYSLAGINVKATQAFGFIDIWLFVVAVMAIALLVLTAIRDTPALPVAMDVLTWWASLLAIFLVLFRVLNAPGPDGVDREIGLWIGALATLGVFGGAHWAMRKQDAPGLRPNPEPELKPAP